MFVCFHCDFEGQPMKSRAQGYIHVCPQCKKESGNCASCNIEYDPFSKEKREAEGLLIHCPDCSVENTTRYLGVQAGNGKMGEVTIIQCGDDASRAAFLKTWRNNSGQNKGKACQLGRHLSSTSGIKFRTVAVNRGNDNHKGKLT